MGVKMGWIQIKMGHPLGHSKLISCFPSTARILFPEPPTLHAATEPHPFILGGVNIKMQLAGREFVCS